MKSVLQAIGAWLLAIPCILLLILYMFYVFLRTSITGEKWNEGRGFYRD